MDPRGLRQVEGPPAPHRSHARVEADAGFVPRSEPPEALAAMRRAYGLKFTFGNATSRLWHRLLRREGERHELISIR